MTVRVGRGGDFLIRAARWAARRLPSDSSVLRPKRFVYVLRSLSDRDRYYTGITSNVRVRLAGHNAGECVHTKRNRPWALDLVIAFRDETRALAFERYLKSGSGCAFAQRHLR